MLITNGTLYQPGIRRRTVNRQVSFGPVTLKLVTIIVFAIACFITLAQTTASATKNYEVGQLMRDEQKKQEEVEMLKIEAARHNALSAVLSESPQPTASPSPKLEDPKQINSLPSTLVEGQ